MALTKVHNRLIEGAAVNVKDFGAVGDGVTDDTTAIQAALDFCKSNKVVCYIPGGFYQVSQLQVPNGVIVQGCGIGQFGIAGDDDNVTVLQQIAGTEDDLVIFKTKFQDSFERIWNGGIKDLILMGDSGGTTGRGISFRKSGDRTSDSIYAIIAGNYFLQNLLIRQFPEDGIYVRRGVTGNVVFRDIGTYFNGGYGINVDTTTALNFLIDNCGGDGNTGGASIKLTTTVRDANVTLINPWGEYRSNDAHGATPSFNAAQPYTVELGDFGSTPNAGGIVNVIGGTSLTSYSTEGPDASIYVNCTANNQMPDVNVVGHKMVNEKSPAITTGNCSLIYDSLNSLRVPGDINTTIYTQRNSTLSGLSGAGIKVFGNDGEYDDISVGTDGVQIKGPTPSISLSETDASANEGRWSWVASGGDLTLRTISDAAVAVTGLTINRIGNAINNFAFSGFLKVSGTDAQVRSGTGTPEGSATAPVGSIFLRTDGGSGTSFYVKESGTGNTGWVAK